MRHFLVVYNRASGERSITEFKSASAAIKRRLEEEALNDDPMVEIVVIGSPSLEDLKITHSRYFRSEELPELLEWVESTTV